MANFRNFSVIGRAWFGTVFPVAACKLCLIPSEDSMATTNDSVSSFVLTLSDSFAFFPLCSPN
jgi:hypothetical protein